MVSWARYCSGPGKPNPAQFTALRASIWETCSLNNLHAGLDSLQPTKKWKVTYKHRCLDLSHTKSTSFRQIRCEDRSFTDVKRNRACVETLQLNTLICVQLTLEQNPLSYETSAGIFYWVKGTPHPTPQKKIFKDTSNYMSKEFPIKVIMMDPGLKLCAYNSQFHTKLDTKVVFGNPHGWSRPKTWMSALFQSPKFETS